MQMVEVENVRKFDRVNWPLTLRDVYCTFLEMLAMVASESSFGAYMYVFLRRPAGLHRDERCCCWDAQHLLEQPICTLHFGRDMFLCLFFFFTCKGMNVANTGDHDVKRRKSPRDNWSSLWNSAHANSESFWKLEYHFLLFSLFCASIYQRKPSLTEVWEDHVITFASHVRVLFFRRIDEQFFSLSCKRERRNRRSCDGHVALRCQRSLPRTELWHSLWMGYCWRGLWKDHCLCKSEQGGRSS